MAYQLDVRKVTEDQYDGSTGAKIDTITSYQLGAEIGGVFVPFLTKQGGYVDALVQRGQEEAQANQPADPAATSSDGGGAQPPAGLNG